MNPTADLRLHEELRLLYRAEADYKVPAAPIVRQLIADAERPLPDALPPPPAWTTFQWPRSGEVNLSGYWREVDRKGKIDWSGPYL